MFYLQAVRGYNFIVKVILKQKNNNSNCFEILLIVNFAFRYLDNICKNPDEEKFQKIKQSNKIFQVRSYYMTCTVYLNNKLNCKFL